LIELAGCIIKDRHGSVLLLHRNDGRHKHWEIPGGKIEPGESQEDTAAREIKEELDVEVAIGEKIGQKEFTDRDKQLHYTWFAAKITDGRPKIAEPQTFDNLDYFSIKQMREMFNDLSMGTQNYLSIIKDE
jgi:8-oxo-dGTP diphosphatase